MSIDLHEALIRLLDVPRVLDTRPSHSAVVRWHLKGVRGVRLETVLIGGRRYTSREAIARFVERTTAAAGGECKASTTKQRQRAIEQAERQLAEDGI